MTAFVVAEDAALRSRLTECLETILNKAQEPPKSKKVQHSNAKNAVLFEAISLIIHHDRLVIFTVTGSLLVVNELLEYHGITEVCSGKGKPANFAEFSRELYYWVSSLAFRK